MGAKGALVAAVAHQPRVPALGWEYPGLGELSNSAHQHRPPLSWISVCDPVVILAGTPDCLYVRISDQCYQREAEDGSLETYFVFGNGSWLISKISSFDLLMYIGNYTHFSNMKDDRAFCVPCSCNCIRDLGSRISDMRQDVGNPKRHNHAYLMRKVRF